MKWESFAPKLSLAACAVLDMIASVFVVYNVGGGLRRYSLLQWATK